MRGKSAINLCGVVLWSILAACASAPRESPSPQPSIDPELQAYLESQMSPDFEKHRKANAEEYLGEHNDLTDEIKHAIRKGKIILGMCPEDARIAGGRCEMAYSSFVPDPRWGENPNPLDVMLAQRNNPDSSCFTLMFQNRTQFKTNDPVAFSVFFEKGRSVRIERTK